MASKDLNFKINGKSIGHTKYQGYARNFELIVDEPEMLGGEDSAANPVEYLLAGYAGCLNVVFGIVAKELAIEIQSLKINIDGDINPEKFLGISNDERAGFKSLNVGISLITNSDKEKEDLLFKTVRNRCPINDNLSNPTPINYIYN
ncbi:MAG: OsmC family protein [Paludibacter sp.]|jgi:uncharacterized OsmC-like protein